jgi:RNA polymerase sigma factor (sigma-70 family)
MKSKRRELQECSDEKLWQAIVDADSIAWEVLVGRYSSFLYAVTLRMGLSQEDAGDCFQHTWSALYINRESIRDSTQLPSWLAKTCKREALRVLHKNKSYAPEEAAIDAVDPSPLTSEELERLEQQARLEIALTMIGERCHKLLHALFFEERNVTYEEIARELKIALNSLGPIRRRCLDKLKKLLE